MRDLSATSDACPNIAFIKYWGDRDPLLHLPASGSISMNLDGLYSRTQVIFDSSLNADQLTLDGHTMSGTPLERVSKLLERVRQMAGLRQYAAVASTNNFPMGAGIASSASAFAALSLAAATAAGLALNESELSRLARTGSGSACRSVPAGFVEWRAGDDDANSYGYSIAPPDYWDLVDCIAIVSQVHKPTGSSEGHTLADSSPLQAARLEGAARRLELCRKAILDRDFTALTEVVELDCNLMHAVMMTSAPPLLYWQPATLAVIQAVVSWRQDGLPVCYTIDAGPNVHVLCRSQYGAQVAARLSQIPGVEQILTAHPGGAARLLESPISTPQFTDP
jgi:diphosphomevalonate decarboxylase